MALVRDLSSAQLAFQVAGGSVDQFDVVRYRGTEGLCQLYRFEIELVTDEEQISFDDVVGKPGVLSINSDTGTKWFHGIVSQFEFTGEADGRMKFRAELVPAVWLLTHRYNSRIFQQKTVKEIITTVLEMGGIPSDRIKLDGVKGADLPREYCVQYRETDFNFICRLMEEEGIWWYFEQTQEGHTFTAADNKSEYADIEGESAELPFKPPSGMLALEEHVFSFRKAQSVRFGKVVLNDFNFKNPKLNLESLSDAGRDTGLEFFDYPGEFDAQAVGGNLAKMRVEEFEASRTRGVGRSNSVRLSPGKKFELTEHSSEPMNQPYLVTRVTHQGRQSITDTSVGAANGSAKMFSSSSYQNLVAATRTDDRTVAGIATATLDLASRLSPNDRSARRTMTEWLYHAGQICRDVSATAGALGGNPIEALSIPNLIEDVSRSEALDLDMPVFTCDFECIPAEVEYRPPRITPWPVMRGCQTARVVGPQSEEIHCDEFGRVKVQFNWDREGGHKETASCWIRVCQGMAGGNYGMMFLPRIGQEVIVDFLEGDPDQPIIIGRVYNADHMPPYKLPDEKTKSVIKTRSSTGGGGTNEIRFEDLKDKEQLFIQAQRMMDTRVKASHMHTIGGSYHLDVGGEKDGELHGEYRQLIYEAKQTHVKGEERTWIEKDESHQVDGMVSIKVGGTRSTTVGKDVVDKFGAAHKHDVAMVYALKALGVKIEGSTGIELKCGGSSIILTPGAIFITAPLVNINSGSGPPVTPPTAKATSPTKTEDPSVADRSEPGTDTTYSGGAELVPLEPQDETDGHEFPPGEEEETETSWIEIELKDQFGDPIPSARFEITTPDEKIKTGTTDSNGKARVSGIVPGECKIKFLDLDVDAVDKVG